MNQLAGAISPESGSQNPTPRALPLKQRRQRRSCDICRQRKGRCDGPQMPDGCCSNCLAFGSACTYVQPYNKRGPKYATNGTTEELKKEIAHLKAKLRSLSVCSLCSQPLRSQAQGDDSSSNISASPGVDPEEPPEEQDLATVELAKRFSQFSLTKMTTSYFGAASNFALVNKASMMKEKYFGPSSSTHSRRPYFWQPLPWEKESLRLQPSYVYPPNDLIASLLEIYFTNVHPTIPILHRPSFERSVAEGLHFTDRGFGGALLSVLALASRNSTDPRVFLESGAPHSAGWKFASQLWSIHKFFEPTIYEIQMYALLSVFVLGTSAPYSSWLYAGLGIRSLQQSGQHRRKPAGHQWSPEDELWKRAFWTLFAMERIGSVFLGRPMGLHVEEYDVEFPLEVDDEYWDKGFMQPAGRPSQLSYFVCYVQLCEILGDAVRRLYGSKKAKILMGWDGQEWEQRAVAELDSTMNRFLDLIPSHLRWDPENLPQGIFFDQSAQLHITYNYVLIAIHRRYIQRPSTPSLSICASAARAILHTADIWLRKLQRVPLPNVTNPVFLAGVILVLYTLGTKRAGLPMDKNKDLAHVETALEILKFAEARLQPSGRSWELLMELRSLDGPLLTKAPPKDQSDGAEGIARPSLSNEQYPPQFEQPIDSWNNMLTSCQPPESMLGKSVEELLASNGQPFTVESIFDDNLMSMWMAAPISSDFENIQHWDAFTENRMDNGASGNWSFTQSYP
ncbi:fungal-specific transcription factor domain-containing protein [Mycena sanguinolenta]|nr:fungal-specific transcription factor domain-containing protein [Mycena sanguinolenta]